MWLNVLRFTWWRGIVERRRLQWIIATYTCIWRACGRLWLPLTRVSGLVGFQTLPAKIQLERQRRKMGSLMVNYAKLAMCSCWETTLQTIATYNSKPVSQSRAVAKKWKILAGHWTIKLGRQKRRLLHWPVSQSRAVAKNENFWRTTGQSSLADRREDCCIGQKVVVWAQNPNFGRSRCGQQFVCQVWLSSGPPEFFTFSYCAWVWNWLIRLKLRSTYPTRIASDIPHVGGRK